jgi:hypothetical protein
MLTHAEKRLTQRNASTISHRLYGLGDRLELGCLFRHGLFQCAEAASMSESEWSEPSGLSTRGWLKLESPAMVDAE